MSCAQKFIACLKLRLKSLLWKLNPTKEMLPPMRVSHENWKTLVQNESAKYIIPFGVIVYAQDGNTWEGCVNDGKIHIRMAGTFYELKMVLELECLGIQSWGCHEWLGFFYL